MPELVFEAQLSFVFGSQQTLRQAWHAKSQSNAEKESRSFPIKGSVSKPKLN
jgi:hypothetical protein